MSGPWVFKISFVAGFEAVTIFKRLKSSPQFHNRLIHLASLARFKTTYRINRLHIGLAGVVFRFHGLADAPLRPSGQKEGATNWLRITGRNWVNFSTGLRLCQNIRQMEFPTYSGPGNMGMLYDQPLRPRMSLSNIVDIRVPCVRWAGCILQYSRRNFVMCLD